jgi:hypothetical protein
MFCYSVEQCVEGKTRDNRERTEMQTTNDLTDIYSIDDQHIYTRGTDVNMGHVCSKGREQRRLNKQPA